MEPEGSQEPITCPYPEPDESRPHPPISYIFKIHFNIMLTSTLRCFKYTRRKPVRPTRATDRNPRILRNLITVVKSIEKLKSALHSAVANLNLLSR
jgi:hypothetical protein